MRDWLSRLRAVCTPQILLALAAALFMMICGFGAAGSVRDDGKTALERRIEHVLSQIEGAGRVSVVIATRPQEQSGSMRTPDEQPSGVVAVAPGASDPLVRFELQEALCALLGLSASAVCVSTGGK